MKEPYFNNPKLISSLYDEAMSWEGTPFIPYAAIKQAGVDCIKLCARTLQAVGATIPPDRDWPKYAMDGGSHNADSQLVQFLVNRPEFELVWSRACNPSDYVVNGLAGDVLCFNISRSSHHAGLFLGGTRFIHSMFRRKVEVMTLADGNFSRRLIAAFRPIR